MGAGESAQAEFVRRRARDRARRRRNLKWSIPWVLLTPLVIYGVVRLGVVFLNEVVAPYLVESVTSVSDPGQEPSAVETDPSIPDSLAHRIGLVAAAIATLREMSKLWGTRQTTEAWGKGAEGERATGHALDRLPTSFVVVHDLQIPGRKENVDHLVIGPSGVFTIETKNYKHEVVIRAGKVTSRGRSLNGVVAQANRQADAITQMLEVPVRPLVCVHGGLSVEGWSSKPMVDGVRFCTGRRIAKLLADAPNELAPEQVDELAARLPGYEAPLAEPHDGSAWLAVEKATYESQDDAPPTPAVEIHPAAPAPPPSGPPPGSASAPGSTGVETSAAVPVARKCWRCSSPMVERERRADGKVVWGCSTHPKCRHTRTD